MATGPDLLVVGDCNPDLVLRGHDLRPGFGQREQVVGDAELTIGGSAAITACGAARLGLRTALAALLGPDAFGAFMREQLEASGVSTEFVRTQPCTRTGVTVGLVRGDDRAMLTYPGAMAAFAGEHVDRAALRGASHVHVCSVFLQPLLRRDLAALLAEARAGGATTSLDPGWDPSERWDDLDDILGELDFFMPNDREAAYLGGAEDPREAARALAGRGPTVVVKLGAAGALAYGPDGVRCAAAPRVDVADTTGAGDSFAAAFLATLLRGGDLDACLRAACVAGALATTAVGGTAGQPDRRRLEDASGLHGGAG